MSAYHETRGKMKVNRYVGQPEFPVHPCAIMSVLCDVQCAAEITENLMEANCSLDELHVQSNVSWQRETFEKKKFNSINSRNIQKSLIRNSSTVSQSVTQ